MNSIQQCTFENSFPIYAFGIETERQVLKYCKKTKLICILFSVVIFQNFIVAFYVFDINGAEVNLIGLAISKYFGNLSSFLQLITFLSYMILLYGSVILPLFVIYCISHIKIQIRLLKANLFTISQDVNDFGLIYDKKYQKTVRLTLRQCVIHHLNIKR